jgi:hypothetical protein
MSVSHKAVIRTALVVVSTSVGALGLASPSQADVIVLDQSLGGACPSYCAPQDQLVGVGFDNSQPNILVNFIKSPESDCPDFTVDVDIDGKTPVTLGQAMPMAPGRHSLNFRHASCPGGKPMTLWKGNAQVTDIAGPGADAAGAAGPKQGPTVTPNPGLAGVTFHVTDRSGVASQCTYSSEGFDSSFGLGANDSFDLFVPAIRLFKNRTGQITCDNGTSTKTSVFY